MTPVLEHGRAPDASDSSMTEADRRGIGSQPATGPSIAFTHPVGSPDAPLLVLGHSLGTSAALWADAVPLLAQSFQVICWDLPGHGNSPAANGAFTIGDLSDRVVRQLDAYGVSRFLYAGASIGGTVGLDLAFRYGDRVSAVAVLSSGACVDSRATWVQRAESVRANGTDTLVAGSLQGWFAPSTRELHPDRVQRMLRALHDADDRSYACACEALGAYDLTSRLAEVVPPVLALWGQYDRLVPESRSAQIALGVRRGVIQCVPDAAHTCPLEQPETVAGQLTDFFDAVISPESGSER